MGLFDEAEKTRRAKQNPQTAKLLALTRALDQARRRRDDVLAKAREAEDAFQAARSALRDFEAVLDAKSNAIFEPAATPESEFDDEAFQKELEETSRKVCERMAAPRLTERALAYRAARAEKREKILNDPLAPRGTDACRAAIKKHDAELDTDLLNETEPQT